LPDDAQLGEDLSYEIRVGDDTRTDPFINHFSRRVVEYIRSDNGKKGKRVLPAIEGQGDRQLPDGLSMPNVIEVHEEDWQNVGFDRSSALLIKHMGETEAYDFYVNLDNIYLKTDIRRLSDKDHRLLESRFKYGLVIMGLAIIKARENINKSKNADNDEESVERYVYDVSKALAPVILPMIDTLGDLEIDENVTSLEESEDI
jgi:hypothetical protein